MAHGTHGLKASRSRQCMHTFQRAIWGHCSTRCGVVAGGTSFEAKSVY